MRFLLEDKTLTLSDADYKKVVDILKQQNIKTIKTADAEDEYNKKDAWSEFNKNVLPEHKKEFIASINKDLADSKDFDSIYDILANYQTNELFKSTVAKSGSLYKDKPNSLRATAQLLDNGKLDSRSLGFVLNDKTFFNESDNDIAFKLKAIALIHDKESRKAWAGENTHNNKVPISDVFLMKTGSQPENDPTTVVYLDRAGMEKKLLGIEDRHHRKERNDVDREAQAAIDKENQEKGFTGRDIIAKSLNKKSDKLTKNDFYDYVKSLSNNTKMKAMADGIVDTGEFNDELSDIVKARYKSEIGEEPIEVMNRQIVKALDKEINRIGK